MSPTIAIRHLEPFTIGSKLQIPHTRPLPRAHNDAMLLRLMRWAVIDQTQDVDKAKLLHGKGHINTKRKGVVWLLLLHGDHR
jgi:hypothetical protein